jgi:hypothetical protein
MRISGAQPRKTSEGGGLQQRTIKNGQEQLQRVSDSALRRPWRLAPTHPTSIRMSQPSLRSLSELSTRRWSTGARRWNWSSAFHEKGVAVIPEAGRSSTLDARNTQQQSAASVAERALKRFCALRVQGRARTKKGPWRRISTFKAIVYQSSTTLKARTSRAIRTGLQRSGLRRSWGGCQRPKGVGWRGVAGDTAVPEKAVCLVVGGPNMDSFSWLRGCSPCGASTSLCSATMSRGALPAVSKEEEREESAGAEQTARPPSMRPEHGGSMQEWTGFTRLSPSAGPSPECQPPLRRPRLNSEEACSCVLHQQESCIRTRGTFFAASLVIVVRRQTRSPKSGRAALAAGGGRGGSAVRTARSGVARRGRRVGEEARHLACCMAAREEHLFAHGHPTARGIVSPRPARALQHSGRASAATEWHIPRILRHRRIRRLRRRRSGPSFDAASDALLVRERISPPCGAGRDFLAPGSVQAKPIFTTTRDAYTGPSPTSRAINKHVFCSFFGSNSSFRASDRLGSGFALRWAWECA